MGETANIKSHYEAHSDSSYESAYFYSPGEYTTYLCNLVETRLGLKGIDQRRKLLDVGGGTGNFTRMLVDNNDGLEAVVIEPFLQKSDVIEDDKLRFVQDNAERFATEDDVWWRKGFHQVLMKEVVHHLDPSDRVKIYEGILRDLRKSGETSSPNPSILIVTRPQIEIDYPLWSEARKVWAANQPSAEDLMSELVEAGFQKVTSSVERYPCQIGFAQWVKMVKQRFWSTFSQFSDDELNDGCEELEALESSRIDKDGIIRFEDRLVLISASMP